LLNADAMFRCKREREREREFFGEF